MKSYLPILTIALIFASCTTAYKSGQTPDDVYYSPARPAEEYVALGNNDNNGYYTDEDYRDDRYLRMKVHNRNWSTLDDNWYSYNPDYYSYYNNYMYYNNPWFSYSYGGYYYNPMYSRVIVINSKAPVNNRPRTFNLNVYNPPQNNTSTGRSHGIVVNVPGNSSYNKNNNYNNSGRNAGSFLRNVFSNSGSSNSNSSSFGTTPSAPSRSSSSSSSGSSGSSSGHAPARKF